jgi:imidazole glycerol-phosphate synthase subunit HisF
MNLPRIIPVLLLKDSGLYKSVKFKAPKYIGDPLNAVKIFNEKEVDELVFIDITATIEKRKPPVKFLSAIASECFMPLCYGGGISTMEDVRSIINTGVEKVSINSFAAQNPGFIKIASQEYGSSTIVVSIDVKKSFFGKYEVFTHGGKVNTKLDPQKYAVQVAKAGAGEILLNSIDRDGTMQGYDLELIKKVTHAVDIPVIACGGAGKITDFAEAITAEASALAAGSMFVFHGKHKAVLINYPSKDEFMEVFENN